MEQTTRAVLFDIDGTLITTGGAGGRSWRQATERLYGTPADISAFTDEGMTDPTVARLTFRQLHGRDPDPRETAQLTAAYLQALPDEIAASAGYRVLDGVEALLPRLAADGVLMGVVTGALEAAAHVKLARAGLGHWFPFGGYGSDSPDRAELTRAALRRGGQVCGTPLEAPAVLVVGDTPRRHHGRPRRRRDRGRRRQPPLHRRAAPRGGRRPRPRLPPGTAPRPAARVTAA